MHAAGSGLKFFYHVSILVGLSLGGPEQSKCPRREDREAACAASKAGSSTAAAAWSRELCVSLMVDIPSPSGNEAQRPLLAVAAPGCASTMHYLLPL